MGIRTDDPASRSKRWLNGVLIAVAGCLVALAISISPTAFAAEGEEGGETPPGELPPTELPVDPIPDPPVLDPDPTPSDPSPDPSPTPTSPGTGQPTNPTPRSVGATPVTPTAPSTPSGAGTRRSGGAIRNPASGGANHQPTGQSTLHTGSSGTGTGTGAPRDVGAAFQDWAAQSFPSTQLDRLGTYLVVRAGLAPAKNKKAQRESVAHIGKAIGLAVLGSAVSVPPPPPSALADPIAFISPVKGKDKLVYNLLILALVLVVATVVALELRAGKGRPSSKETAVVLYHRLREFRPRQALSELRAPRLPARHRRPRSRARAFRPAKPAETPPRPR